VTTYWTIQDLPAWEQAQVTKQLTGNPTFIHPDFKPAYDWMVAQMQVRLLPVTPGYPIWLWTTRPDLRESGYAERGTPQVLLHCTLDPASVLLSDYMAWHHVLNEWTLTWEEAEEIDQQKSWERIFDLEALAKHPDWGINTTQGVVPSIPLDQLKLVKVFTAR